MKAFATTTIIILLATQTVGAQNLADLARKERERKGQEKPAVEVSTDEIKRGKVDVTPKLDPARKGDLEYLLQQLARPRVTPELLAAFIPLKDQAIPKVIPMLDSVDPLKRVAPATVLTVLGKSEGVAAMARMLGDAISAAAAPSAPAPGADAAPENAPSPEDLFRQRIESTREATYALNTTRFGVWRFTEGSAMTPEQVVARLEKGPLIQIVGGPDNGQRIFNRALRDADANLRLSAIELIRVATGGRDFDYRVDQPADQNEAAIQQVTTFLTTERARVISQLGTKK